MNDIEKVEELTKALQDGKTLISNTNCNTMKLINGLLCRFYTNNASPDINSYIINPEDWKIQEPEPEPEFEITPNQLAEYECRDGSKAVCYGKFEEDFFTRVLYNDNESFNVLLNGRVFEHKKTLQDLIRKIRDL
jgi:hypothetical protein